MVATKAAAPATMVTARAKRLPVPPVLLAMKTGADEVARVLCSILAILYGHAEHCYELGV
jgi:hypothetical protein